MRIDCTLDWIPFSTDILFLNLLLLLQLTTIVKNKNYIAENKISTVEKYEKIKK